jgi:hypothetical protein
LTLSGARELSEVSLKPSFNLNGEMSAPGRMPTLANSSNVPPGTIGRNDLPKFD